MRSRNGKGDRIRVVKLCKPFCHESYLVLFYTTITIAFNYRHSFAAYNFLLSR